MNSAPAFICWGKEHLLLYNDAFANIYHPLGIGQPVGISLGADWTGLVSSFNDTNKALFEQKLQLHLSTLKDHLGNACGVLGFGQNNSITKATVNTIGSNKEYRISEMVASAPFPIGIYVGREMRILQVNDAIIKVWGKGNDIVGKTYREVLPELENQSIYSQLEHVFDTGIPYHARNQRIDLMIEGQLSTFYFNYSFTPLHDVQGNIYGIMNTAADVTDLFLAKQQVERSEDEFRSMISQAPVAMCL
ncbi:MAG: PAS domain S-box protein, partial [Flavobacterium sp.]